MNALVLVLLFLPAPQATDSETSETQRLDELIRKIEKSGRVIALVREPEDRLRIAPGAPPLLAFRYLEGRERGRFGGLDLVLDDAGH